MIGSAIFNLLAEVKEWEVRGTLRSSRDMQYFPLNAREKLIAGVVAESQDSLLAEFASFKPDVVINCIGLTKHYPDLMTPLRAIPLNAMLPHRLVAIAGISGARFIHISTDCVFAGTRGNYSEDDQPDATDLYGQSKYLGEVDEPYALTLRTSTIGHELQTRLGLLEWFLRQNGACKGHSRAIFSGLTNVEFARVVRDFVIPFPKLQGLYNVGGDPISKYQLLREVAAVYGVQTKVNRDEDFVIDRSLDSGRFRRMTGYIPPDWTAMIKAMRSSHLS
jgi:dTDP-4-dehydrorhamnose reductase